MITSAVQTFEAGLLSPSLIEKSIYENSRADSGSWMQNVAARALFVAQAIVSVVALPLNLLAIIFGSALTLCVEGTEAAWMTLKATTRLELVHLAFIPAGLLGAVAPEISGDIRDSLQRWVNDI